jgi:hypothetical protein
VTGHEAPVPTTAEEAIEFSDKRGVPTNNGGGGLKGEGSGCWVDLNPRQVKSGSGPFSLIHSHFDQGHPFIRG